MHNKGNIIQNKKEQILVLDSRGKLKMGKEKLAFFSLGRYFKNKKKLNTTNNNPKKAVSIVEAIVIILIVTMGLIGVYNIYTRSIKTVTNMGNKIEAIQIAREGLEAMMNVRDTNWLLFPSDKKNCWKTLNYDNTCIGKNDFLNKIQDSSYKIYRDENGRWKLEEKLITMTSSSLVYSNENYRNFFKVGIDDNGLYTQDEAKIEKEKLPLFTREIKIESVSANEELPPFDNAIKVESIVKWVDNSSTSPQEVKLDLILTNHEYKPEYAQHWEEGVRGECSVSCGGGIQTRSVTCKDENGIEISEYLCEGSKPESTRSCNEQACNAVGNCTGTLPSNSSKTTQDTYNRIWNGTSYVPLNEETNRSYNGSVCGYKCNSGFTWEGGICVSHGTQERTVPGINTWTVPEGVTSIKISGVGGGGGSTWNQYNTSSNYPSFNGGNGCSYLSGTLQVLQGDKIKVEVGLGGARGSSYLGTVGTKGGSTRVWHNETLVLELEGGASTKSSSNLGAYCSGESSRSSYTNAGGAYCYTTMTGGQITQGEHAHYNGCNAKTVPGLNITTTAGKFPVGTGGRGPWLVNLSYYTNENHAGDGYVRISR